MDVGKRPGFRLYQGEQTYVDRYSWPTIAVGTEYLVFATRLVMTRLIAIRDDPSQHFHFRSDYQGTEGVADIEFFVKSVDDPDNMARVESAQGVEPVRSSSGAMRNLQCRGSAPARGPCEI